MKYQIKESIIYAEIKRAIKKGLIGELTSNEFNEWCIDWWIKNGLDENSTKCNDGYLRDPYTGYAIDLYNKKSGLVLEHIIPIDRDGGTIIFNVLPSRCDVNSSKSNNDPLEWWLKSGFFSKERFKVFVNYIFDAYDKRIKDGMINLDFDTVSDDELIYDDCIEELDIDYDFQEQSSKSLFQEQLKKINYGQFLASCVVFLEQFDKELAGIYSKKLEAYEKQGVFNNISLYQKVQSIIFNKIKKIDSAKKYEFLKRINMNLLIKSLNGVDNIENEIDNRIDKFIQLIEHENTMVTFNDILFLNPNIICIPNDELVLKINTIRKYNLNNDLMLVLRNNLFLLFLPLEEIPKRIIQIKQTLGDEYFNIFINTSLQYNDMKILNFIKNCTESRQLKNLKKQNLEDTLDVWVNKNTNLKIYVTFINTLSVRIANGSYKYTSFNGTIKQTYIASILKSLYEHVKSDNQILNQTEKLKSLIQEIIWSISNEDMEKTGVFGNNITEQKANLFNLFCTFIDSNLIQTYFYLELIKNKKLLSLEVVELEKDINVVKKYILDSTSLKDLTLEKLNLVTKNLTNIGLLNGNFLTRFNQRIIHLKNYNTDENPKKQLYISKNEVSLITNKLMQKLNFTTEVNLDFLKSTVFNLIQEEVISNKEFFAPLNCFSDKQKINIIVNLFYREIESKTLQNFLMLEQLLRQKKEELSLKELEEEENKRRHQIEQDYKKRMLEIAKITYYINNCTDINQLRFESIDKIKVENSISLNEWINLNIDLESLNINNLNRSFEKSLVDKIRSGSAKYSKKNIERKLITIVIEKLNSELNFDENPSKDTQKEIVNIVISNIINDKDLLSKFDGYKGTTYAEKISNFRNLIFKFIEDGSIETYLFLEQKVIQKVQQLSNNQDYRIKRSA